MVTYERTINETLITHIITHDDIWDDICEYGQTPDEFHVTFVPSQHWVLLQVEHKVIGLFFLDALNSTTAMVHINILKKFRQKYSIMAGRACMKYMLNETDYNKFNTEVPENYPNVMLFLEKFGFIKEGINRNSINKNNTLTDQVYYGMTRVELNQFINRGKQ